MKAISWTPYISDHTVNAICWTLIHSLWIGLATALLTGLVIATTRRSGAALRYHLLCGILVLFVVAAGITFYLEMRSPVILQPSSHVIGGIATKHDQTIIISTAVVLHYSVIDRVMMFLNQNTDIIFIAWLLFFVLKSLKMVGGLLYIQRIRNYKVQDVAEDFKHKIELFSRQIGIGRTVRLVQSELVKVPVAIGWLKPMVLLPVGIILQLSTEQLESILWHELAHIRRRDYLVNILQGLVETIFFFNPGLLWLSSLIRAEREACCDDMVLSRMSRKANYLEALLAVGFEDHRRTTLAMGIGSGNQLRDRLKRMVDKENKRLSMAEKVVLIVGLVALSAFTGLPKTTENAMKHLVDVVINKPAKNDTTKIKAVTVDRGKKQPVTTYKTGVTSADALSAQIDTPVRFRSVLFKMSDSDLTNNDISAETEAGHRYHFIIKDDKLIAADVDGEKVQESDLPKYDYMVKIIDNEVEAKRNFREQERMYAKMRADKFINSKRLDDKYLDVDSMKRGYTKVMNDIIADLVVRNVVSKAADVKWFALTNTGFIVNGQKQPHEIQQKYKERYGVHEGFGLYYGPVPSGGRGVFIDPAADLQFQRYRDAMQSEAFNVKPGPDSKYKNSKLEAMRRQFLDDSARYSTQKNRALNVIADLVHDKVLADPASVKWFGLSSMEFIVNGQKQPDEMQQRYKTKYGIYQDYGLYYGPVQMHGVGVFIDADPLRPPLPPGSPRPSKGPHEPRSAYVQPKYTDTNAWKLRQLIKQQQAFAADQDKQRAKLVEEQQHFLEQENKKREGLVRQQQAFAADQARKREQLLNQQQADQARQREQIERQQQALREGQEMAGLKQQWVSKSGINLQPVITSVISDLVSANVIHDKSDLVKFNLTNSALMVNGMKQPEELHKRLKAKYLEQPSYTGKDGITTDPNFGLHFNAQNGHQGLGVTSGPDSP
jgi:beta-lactamase regulating signal transducer with metallopeptidase domain